MTVTLAVVAALQTVVIGYGLEKHYQTFSRLWMVIKNIWKLAKSKSGKKEKAEKVNEKAKNIQMKIRKSSLKRFAQILYNKLCMLRFVTKTNIQDLNKILHICLSCW